MILKLEQSLLAKGLAVPRLGNVQLRFHFLRRGTIEVIISQPVKAGEELKVGGLPKGIYLLRLQSVGGKWYVRKVVRE